MITSKTDQRCWVFNVCTSLTACCTEMLGLQCMHQSYSLLYRGAGSSMYAPVLQPVVQRCWVFNVCTSLTACCTEVLGLHACTNLTACCTEEGKQALTSVNKWRLGKSKKKSFTLPQPGVKPLPVAKHVSQVTTTPHLVQHSNPDCSSTFSKMVFAIW